jgi:hypothetical protein
LWSTDVVSARQSRDILASIYGDRHEATRRDERQLEQLEDRLAAP